MVDIQKKFRLFLFNKSCAFQNFRRLCSLRPVTWGMMWISWATICLNWQTGSEALIPTGSFNLCQFHTISTLLKLLTPLLCCRQKNTLTPYSELHQRIECQPLHAANYYSTLQISHIFLKRFTWAFVLKIVCSWSIKVTEFPTRVQRPDFFLFFTCRLL